MNSSVNIALKPAKIQTSLVPPKITVGIWFPKTQMVEFSAEGIFRLLSFIIRGWEENSNIYIKIACVSWVKPLVKKYLLQLGVNVSQIEFITVKKGFLIHFSFYKLREIVKIISSFFLSINQKKIKPSSNQYKENEPPKIGTPYNDNKILPINKERSIKASFQDLVKPLLYSIAEKSQKKLFKKMEDDKTIDCWYFPYPSGKYMDKLSKPVVVSLPDIVHLDFPKEFGLEKPEVRQYIDDIVSSIKKAKATISFSNYVRDNHIYKSGFRTDGCCYVIRHAPIDLSAVLGVHTSDTKSEIKNIARKIIFEFLTKNDNHYPLAYVNYLKNISTRKIRYIFVSTQNNPHKNLLNTFQSYELLKRVHKINTKLIVTARLDDQLREFINQRNMNFDIFSLNHLPPQIHAAFYACADFSIVPSLFEGGFPFIFSESLSVGTPTLLSDIPVVRELLPNSQFDIFIFDPYNVRNMAEKIAWAYTHCAEVFRIEDEIYNTMLKRTWKDVSSEYIEVFNSVINHK